MKIRYSSLSETGDRSENEDALRIEEKDGRYIFALADGLGSYGCGRIASDLAVNAVCGCFSENDGSEDILEKAFFSAQNDVAREQRADPGREEMCTTLAALYIRDGSARWAHIGDSRVYCFRNKTLMAFTKDHSYPQMLVALGEISQDEVRGHPDQNILLQVVGRPWEGKPFSVSSVFRIEQSDCFLLCSDGFWEYIDEAGMEKCLKASDSPGEWLRRMVEETEKNGLGKVRDNYSAICIFCDRPDGL